jgi:hypothetical protein
MWHLRIDNSAWTDEPLVSQLAGCIRIPNHEFLDLMMSASTLAMLSLKPECLRSLGVRPIDHGSLPSLLESLPLCCSLESLDICIQDHENEEHYGLVIPETLTLPSLSHLSILDTLHLHLPAFLRALDLVSLERLTLTSNKPHQSLELCIALGARQG